MTAVPDQRRVAVTVRANIEPTTPASASLSNIDHHANEPERNTICGPVTLIQSDQFGLTVWSEPVPVGVTDGI
jgi:hypothetical protein